jgi:hypothetical protein
MLKLDSGNVLLKPSNRRQFMSWLKRAMKFVQRMGNPLISITMHRAGRLIEIRADVAQSGSSAAFRARQSDWKHAAREIIRLLTGYLHDRTVHPEAGLI